MPNKRLIFVTSRLSRQLISFAKKMGRVGFDICVAAPANENLQYLPGGRFVRLGKFWGRLFGWKKIAGIAGADVAAVAFDKAAETFLKKAGMPHAVMGDLGIDLDVWNPVAVSGNRQTMLLSRYNIQPHQKMILVIDPAEKDVKALVQEIQGLERDDFIIGLYGKMSERAAERIGRSIRGVSGIIQIGDEQDLPSLMRASFAIMSMNGKKSFYKTAATAMGRATAWRPDEDMRPNIAIGASLGKTVEKILDLSAKAREKFEEENVRRAQSRGFDRNIEKLRGIL